MAPQINSVARMRGQQAPSQPTLCHGKLGDTITPPGACGLGGQNPPQKSGSTGHGLIFFPAHENGLALLYRTYLLKIIIIFFFFFKEGGWFEEALPGTLVGDSWGKGGVKKRLLAQYCTGSDARADPGAHGKQR